MRKFISYAAAAYMASVAVIYGAIQVIEPSDSMTTTRSKINANFAEIGAIETNGLASVLGISDNAAGLNITNLNDLVMTGTLTKGIGDILSYSQNANQLSITNIKSMTFNYINPSFLQDAPFSISTDVGDGTQLKAENQDMFLMASASHRLYLAASTDAYEVVNGHEPYIVMYGTNRPPLYGSIYYAAKGVSPQHIFEAGGTTFTIGSNTVASTSKLTAPEVETTLLDASSAELVNDTEFRDLFGYLGHNDYMINKNLSGYMTIASTEPSVLVPTIEKLMSGIPYFRIYGTNYSVTAPSVQPVRDGGSIDLVASGASGDVLISAPDTVTLVASNVPWSFSSTALQSTNQVALGTASNLLADIQTETLHVDNTAYVSGWVATNSFGAPSLYRTNTISHSPTHIGYENWEANSALELGYNYAGLAATNYVTLAVKNPAGDYGTLYLRSSPEGFSLYPVGSSVMSLGLSASPWSNVYAQVYYGNGSNLTDIPQPVTNTTTTTFTNSVVVPSINANTGSFDEVDIGAAGKIYNVGVQTFFEGDSAFLKGTNDAAISGILCGGAVVALYPTNWVAPDIAGSVVISAPKGLLPSASSSVDIGSSLFPWNNVYANTGTLTTVNVDGIIAPGNMTVYTTNDTSTGRIGSYTGSGLRSGLSWYGTNTAQSGLVILGGEGEIDLKAIGSVVATVTTNALVPSGSNTIALGSADLWFSDVYAQVYHGDGSNLTNITPPVTNTVTTDFDQTVTFPSIIVAGQLIDGSVSTVSVANVAFDADFVPAASNAYDIGSSNRPVRDIYVSTGTVYFVGGPEIVGLSVNTNGQISAAVGTNAPVIYASTDDGSTKLLEMDDAAGTNTKWTEWAIGGVADTDNNWRMGVVSSNLTVQVRVSGTWTNATVFTRP